MSTTSTVHTLDINAMTCGHCIRSVAAALHGIPGLTVHSITLGQAQVSTPDNHALTRALAALTAAGYPAQSNETPAAPASCRCSTSTTRGVCCAPEPRTQ